MISESVLPGMYEISNKSTSSNLNSSSTSTISSSIEEDDKEPGFDFLMKIPVVGDGGTGKTALMKRYTTDKFSENTLATIGVDFFSKNIEVEGRIIKAQIWDTAGQERFRVVAPLYYRGSAAVIFVYDVTNRNSFDSIRTRWNNQVTEAAESNIIKILIGNKIDIKDRQVETWEGKEMCEQLRFHKFIETSAKTGAGVEAIFKYLVISYHEKVITRSKEKKNDTVVDKQRSISGKQIEVINKQTTQETKCLPCTIL